MNVKKIGILNRGDCCHNRIRGAIVYVGNRVCGRIKNPPKGKWIIFNCNLKGTFVKIRGTHRDYLHICGFHVFGKPGPKLNRLSLINSSAKMSSRWNDKRNKPINPFMNANHFKSRWGNGMTCMHTMADSKGAWWYALFANTKVNVLRV